MRSRQARRTLHVAAAIGCAPGKLGAGHALDYRGQATRFLIGPSNPRRGLFCPVQSRRMSARLDGPQMIRVLRLPDLVGVGMFLRRGGTEELTSHTWPRVQPESGHLPAGAAIWQTLGMAWERAWISAEGRVIDGMISARPRCGGLVWDVEH